MNNIIIYYVIVKVRKAAKRNDASVYYVNALMEPEDAIKGQAYFTMAYTLGSVLGSFLGGTLIDLAGVHAMLLFSTVSAFIGALIVLIFAERTSK